MLQSPKAQGQRYQGQSNSSENPILDVKEDPKCRIQRQTSQQRGSPRRPQHQHHRRIQSVPDSLLMSLSAAHVQDIEGICNAYQTGNLGHDRDSLMEDGCDRQKLHANANMVDGFYMQKHTELSSMPSGGKNIKNRISYFERLSKPTKNEFSETEYASITQYPSFLSSNQEDSVRMIDEMLSFDASLLPHSSSILDQGSNIGSGMPLATNTFTQSIKGSISRAQTFSQVEPALPTPPQSACISAFDLAPLPHTNYINLASLNIPGDNEVESYFPSQTSQSFPQPGQSSPTMHHIGLFDISISTVIEEDVASDRDHHVMTKAPPLPPNSTFDIEETQSERAKSKEVSPTPLNANPTGISMEEISSFIAGPHSDGKWVCLFHECGKRFGRKENIKSHVQTHLGDRQFECKVCKKCFVRQHDLKRHAKIHTGIKPYPCLCGNSFARHDALTRHRQRGMCIGAFEGVVKKVAKRGRPRKRPLDDDGSEAPPKAKKKASRENNSSMSVSDTSSACSSSGSSISDPLTPDPIEFGSPAPETPGFEQYDSSSSSTSRSEKEDSPEVMEHSNNTPDYTPPTSPPEFCELDVVSSSNMTAAESSKRNSSASSSFSDEELMADGREMDYSDLGLPLPSASNSGKSTGSDSNAPSEDNGVPEDNDFSQITGNGDDFLFSQDTFQIFELTTLERDPSILGGLDGEDIYIKPELLRNP